MNLKFFIACLLLPLQIHAGDTLTLNRAVSRALENNLDLQVAENTAAVAHNNNHPGNAGMLPQVSLSLSDNPSLTSINQKFTNGTEIIRNGVFSNAFSAGVLLSYTLFDGNRMFAAKKRLEAADQAAMHELHLNMQEVITSVITAYSNLVRQKEYVTVIERLVDLSEQRMSLVKVRYQAGLANQADLHLAGLDLESVRQNRTVQLAAVQNAYQTLNFLMGVQTSEMYETEQNIVSAGISERTELDSLLTHNPSWLIAEQQCRIAEMTRREIASVRMPLIRLNASYNYNLSQSQAGFSLFNQSTGPQAGLSLTLPLYSGGVNRINIENAKLNQENSRLSKERLMQEIRMYYEQAWNDLNAARLQIASDSGAIASAESLLEIMQERFRLGQSTILELKDAQRAYEETVFRSITNKYALRLAETELLALTGQLAGIR